MKTQQNIKKVTGCPEELYFFKQETGTAKILFIVVNKM